MLQERSYVQVADNTGASVVMLFSVTGKNNRKSVGVGQIVRGSVKKSKPQAKIKKTEIVSILIVRTRKKITRKDGSSIKFSDNAGVIVNKNNGEPMGTRVFGPIAREIKELGFNKVASLAEEVL